MFKKIAILVILLLPTIAAQAFSANLGNVTNVSSMNGTCVAGDLLVIQTATQTTGTINDIAGRDSYTAVLYDGYGLPINYISGMATVGTTASITQLPLLLYTSPQARPFSLKIFDTTSFQTAVGAASYPLVGSITFDPGDFGVCDFLPDVTPIVEDEGTAPHFTDGRINNFDMASPFVVYGHDFEDGRGLVIYSPEGALLLTVHPDAFAVECTGEVMELASDNGVTLYLLPSCEYQLMGRSLDGMKNYILIFNEPYPNTGYTSYEE